MTIKLCECGCGEPTKIITHTTTRQGRIKGEYSRFLPGHDARVAPIRGPDHPGWKPGTVESRKWAKTKADPRRRTELNAHRRELERERRLRVLEYYGGKCACCGEDRFEFLAIDHIDGGGTQHRKKVRSNSLTQWLERNNYPEGFRVLCHNCNAALGAYGYCPHDNLKEVQNEAR